MKNRLRQKAAAIVPLLKDRLLPAQFLLMGVALAVHAFRPGYLPIALFFALAGLAALTVLARAVLAFAEAPGDAHRGAEARRLASCSVAIMAWAIVAGLLVDTAQRLSRSAWLQGEALKIRDILFFQPGEYLFFLGLTLAAAYLAWRRRGAWALVCLVLALVWAAYYRPVVAFLNSLGVDAFSELDEFSLSEASFWLSTLAGLFQPELKAKRIAFYIVSAGLLFAGLAVLSRRAPRARSIAFVAIPAVLMAGGVYLTLAKSAALFFDNSRAFLLTKKNFEGDRRIAVRGNGAPMDVLVYIGESTSTMNMGIYGYPRDTTPRLSAIERDDPGFVKFDHVLSTHTHTAWSLLEALSVGFDPAEDFLPINYRHRMSVVDLFSRGGIEPKLISNQGSTGTWNMASSVIFSKAAKQFSTRSTLFGSDDYKLARPWDHELFESVRQLGDGVPEGNQLVFFHSYAGHGDYRDNIPQEFRKQIDDFLARSPARAMVGPLVDHLPNIEAYDSAVRYIDNGVSDAIEHTRRKSGPAILVYFSDHGDAVYAGRGHDSSRFIHEMARVPFVVYFNDAARKARPELFRKYRALAQRRTSATLAQLPWTLFDLMGVDLDGPDAKSVHRLPVIGEKVEHAPIALRETIDGITYVNVNASEVVPPPTAGRRFIDVTDYATRYHAVHTEWPSAPPSVCYHAANTFAKARRGAMVADCLEADFMVEPNGDVNIYHPPKPNIGFSGARFAEAAAGKSIWVDAKNLTEPSACAGMEQFLRENRKSFASIVVEFPSQTYQRADELRKCTVQLRGMGVALSYYVPTDSAIACAQEVEARRASGAACASLERDLRKAHESGLFTDVSFDYKGAAAIASMPFLKGYAKNTWNVMPQDFAKIGPQGFRLVILNNDDPNSP